MNIESFEDFTSRYSSIEHYISCVKSEVGDDPDNMIEKIRLDLETCTKREWGLIRPALTKVEKEKQAS